MTDNLKGVTPLAEGKELPKGPVIVFTGVALKCPCSDSLIPLTTIPERAITCPKCHKLYDLPTVSYRWPPVSILRTR